MICTYTCKLRHAIICTLGQKKHTLHCRSLDNVSDHFFSDLNLEIPIRPSLSPCLLVDPIATSEKPFLLCLESISQPNGGRLRSGQQIPSEAQSCQCFESVGKREAQYLGIKAGFQPCEKDFHMARRGFGLGVQGRGGHPKDAGTLMLLQVQIRVSRRILFRLGIAVFNWGQEQRSCKHRQNMHYVY